MKKITLALCALIMGFVMASCNNVSPKDGIMKDVDEFFTQAEQEITSIDNAAELVDFVFSMPEKKEKLVQLIADKYGVDEEGNFKGIHGDDAEELEKFLNERATKYNEIEYDKCGEIMAPYIDNFTNFVDGLYEKYQQGVEPTEEELDVIQAMYDEIELYQTIVPQEQAEQFYDADAKVAQILGVFD